MRRSCCRLGNIVSGWTGPRSRSPPRSIDSTRVGQVVTEVLDVSAGKVTGVRIKNTKTGADSLLPCAGVFVAIGHHPNTRIFEGLLKLDDNGYVERVRGSETSVPGIYGAGDVIGPPWLAHVAKFEAVNDVVGTVGRPNRDHA